MTPEQIESIKQIILDILKHFGISADVEAEDSITSGLVFNITTPDSYLLIGRGGATLHALQLLVWQLAAKKLQLPTMTRFMLDVDDYKRKREWYLKETAKQAVEKLSMTGREVALEPMPNYERRLIHAYLQERYPDVSSESQGFEPRRRIVIRQKK